jgi:hypothetical protein
MSRSTPTAIPTGPSLSAPATTSTPSHACAPARNPCAHRPARPARLRQLCSSPPTGNGPASATAMPWPSPATSSMSGSPRLRKGTRAALRSSRTPAPRARCWPWTTPAATSWPWSAAATTRLGLQPRHSGRETDRFQLQALRLYRRHRGRRQAHRHHRRRPVSFGAYVPHNYENDYKGAMTVANAFAESRNIPALKLAARVGIHKVIDMAHRFGVTENIPAYLPIALGAVEINARGAGRFLRGLSQRRHSCDAARHSQGLQRRRHRPLAGDARRQRGHQPSRPRAP